MTRLIWNRKLDFLLRQIDVFNQGIVDPLFKIISTDQPDRKSNKAIRLQLEILDPVTWARDCSHFESDSSDPAQKRIVLILPTFELDPLTGLAKIHSQQKDLESQMLGVASHNVFRDQFSGIDVLVLDSQQISEALAPTPIFDRRLIEIGALPWSIDFCTRLARLIIHLHNSIHENKPKLMLFDLDETLWPGNLAERGAANAWEIEENEIDAQVRWAYARLREAMKKSRRFGQLIGLITKNNVNELNAFLTDVSGTHLQDRLRLEDFDLIRADWSSKSSAIIEAAEYFGFKVEQLAFFDNDEREQSEVRFTLPQVHCPHLPNDPLERCLRLIDEIGWLHPFNTSEDQLRAQSYKANRKRELIRVHQSKDGAKDNLEWLASLHPELSLIEITRDLPAKLLESLTKRGAQLFQRTNQFHLTRNRIDERTLIEETFKETGRTWMARYKDDLGDDGWIAIFKIVLMGDQQLSFQVSEFVLSCRAFNRCIEDMLMNFMLSKVSEALESSRSDTGESPCLYVSKPVNFSNSKTREFFEKYRRQNVHLPVLHGSCSEYWLLGEVQPKENSGLINPLKFRELNRNEINREYGVN
jgi:FkbH-like protein